MPSNHYDLLSSWNRSGMTKSQTKLWNTILACVWWTIWRGRNSRCFEGTSIQKDQNDLYFVILFLVQRRISEWWWISFRSYRSPTRIGLEYILNCWIRLLMYILLQHFLNAEFNTIITFQIEKFNIEVSKLQK